MKYKHTPKSPILCFPLLLSFLLLTGCSSLHYAADLVKQDTISSADQIQLPSDTDSGTTNDSDTESTENTSADDRSETSSDEAPLLLTGSQKIFSVYPDGSISTLYEKPENETILQAVMDEQGILYVATTDEPYDYETNTAHLYAINDGNVTYIDNVPNYSLQIDFYDGSLFVQYIDYDSEDYGTCLLNYTLTADGTYEKQSRYQNLYDSLEADGYSAVSGLIASLKKYDQVITTSDRTVAGFDAQGNQLWNTELSLESPSVFTANTNYVLYTYNEWIDATDSTPYHYIQSNILHNIQTGEEQTISTWDSLSNESQSVFIKMDEDAFYYHTHNTENGLDHYSIYRYDLNTNEISFLYETSTLPGPGGRWEISPGVTDFNFYHGKFYYRSITEDHIGWAAYDPSTNSQNQLPITDEERTLARYGTISCTGDSLMYDELELDIYDYYVECFRFHDTYAQASSLNDAMETIYTDFLAYVQQSADSELNYLAESDPVDISGSIYPYSYDMYIDQVMPIGSHYFAIDYAGYEYWGGAHGYPYREHYLLDLDTGAQLTFSNIYSGSEEQFKDVVASYSVQHWKENSEIYFFDPATDENIVYQDFYDNARLDMLIRFEQASLVIEYSPYEYGSYAAGYIEVEIPYEAFGIKVN